MKNLGRRVGVRRWLGVVGCAAVGALLASGLGSSPSALAAGGKRLRVKQGDDVAAAMAEARLLGGRPLLAAEMAKACLDQRPDAQACRLVYLRSLAAAGRCEQALPDLRGLRTTETWDGELALAEGMCLLRAGDPAGAREAFAEAMSYKEKDAMFALEYGVTSVRLGDLDAAVEARDAILRYTEVDWMADALDLWVAAWREDTAVDAMLHQALGAGITRSRPFAVQVALIDCERWLDLDDPVAADAAGRRGIKFTNQATRLLACRAEALRRQGWVGESWELVSRPWNEVADTPALDAVKARLLVDRGELAEARALLARMADDSEAIAARWYLAERTGEVDAAAALRIRWDVTPHPPLRALDQYLPLPPA